MFGFLFLACEAPTLLCRFMAGEACGVMDTGVRRPSIIDITLSGTLVISVHLSCQLGIWSVSMSFAFKVKHSIPVNEKLLPTYIVKYLKVCVTLITTSSKNDEKVPKPGSGVHLSWISSCFTCSKMFNSTQEGLQNCRVKSELFRKYYNLQDT